jgi:hypothetical protein
MTVLTWQNVAGVAILLAPDLRVSNPANLDMSQVVYEAPQNSHRDTPVLDRLARPVRVSPNELMGLASVAVPEMLSPANAKGFQAGRHWGVG